MTERPIPFNAPMVRAVLAGTKTQTRPAMYVPSKLDRAILDLRYPPSYGDGEWPNLPPGKAWTLSNWRKVQPGDRLWVREAFRFTDVFDADSPSRVGERCVDAGYRTPWAPIQFEADRARLNWQHTGTPPHEGQPRPGKLRPAMFMPRWASRITLEVTGVRVERLQDISEADAQAEGAPSADLVSGRECIFPHQGTYRWGFRLLWESINGPGSWDANPWVWVVEFKRAEAQHAAA